MKRNVHLQPLSRQHHNGLLAVLLLSKGLAKEAPPGQLRDFIGYLFEQDLRHHFALEETYLLPVFQQHPELLSGIQRLQDEHAQLRALRDSICINPEISSIEDFTTLLEKHIRFEERELFPAAEKLLGEDELAGIGHHLHHRDDRNCMQYPVKFWE